MGPWVRFRERERERDQRMRLQVAERTGFWTGVFAVRFGMILSYFYYLILWCNLSKVIIAAYLIFVVTYTVRCSLEFSQNNNCIALHFCSHMYGTMYKMRFERFEESILLWAKF